MLSLDKMPELMVAQEVAEYLRVAKYTLKRYEKNGWLVPMRIGQIENGHRRFLKADVINMLKRKGIKV